MRQGLISLFRWRGVQARNVGKSGSMWWPGWDQFLSAKSQEVTVFLHHGSGKTTMLGDSTNLPWPCFFTSMNYGRKSTIFLKFRNLGWFPAGTRRPRFKDTILLTVFYYCEFRMIKMKSIDHLQKTKIALTKAYKKTCPFPKRTTKNLYIWIHFDHSFVHILWRTQPVFRWPGDHARHPATTFWGWGHWGFMDSDGRNLANQVR